MKELTADELILKVVAQQKVARFGTLIIVIILITIGGIILLETRKLVNRNIEIVQQKQHEIDSISILFRDQAVKLSLIKDSTFLISEQLHVLDSSNIALVKENQFLETHNRYLRNKGGMDKMYDTITKYLGKIPGSKK